MTNNDRAKRTALIANKIIGLRQSAAWSQSELARRAGVTSAAISQIEKGDRMPSLIVLRKLAEAFHVSMADLTGDSPAPPKEANDKAQVFFRKFGDVEKLSKADQQIIESLIQSLKDKYDNKR